MDAPRLRGLLAFTPTPFDDTGAVDAAALERHSAYLADSGVDAVVVAGGVGEFYALDDAEYATVVAATVSGVAGRVPVLAGVGHSTDIAVRLARRAARLGVDALMVNPFYFIDADLDGVVAHYRRLGAATDLGLVVFSTRGSVYGPDQLARLADVPEVVAVKDEYGDLDLFVESRRQLGKRFTWISGMAEPAALGYARAGADAMTSGLVNLDPRLSAQIYQAAWRGDERTYHTLMDVRADPILALRRRRPGYHITVLKEAMAQLGRIGSRVRLPLVPLRADERDMLRSALVTGGYVEESRLGRTVAASAMRS